MYQSAFCSYGQELEERVLILNRLLWTGLGWEGADSKSVVMDRETFWLVRQMRLLKHEPNVHLTGLWSLHIPSHLLPELGLLASVSWLSSKPSSKHLLPSNNSWLQTATPHIGHNGWFVGNVQAQNGCCPSPRLVHHIGWCSSERWSLDAYHWATVVPLPSNGL